MQASVEESKPDEQRRLAVQVQNSNQIPPLFWLSNYARMGDAFEFRMPKEDEDDFCQSDALIMSPIAFI